MTAANIISFPIIRRFSWSLINPIKSNMLPRKKDIYGNIFTSELKDRRYKMTTIEAEIFSPILKILILFSLLLILQITND